MIFRKTLATFLSLLIVAGCVSAPELSQDHPAHPDAKPAPSSPEAALVPPDRSQSILATPDQMEGGPMTGHGMSGQEDTTPGMTTAAPAPTAATTVSGDSYYYTCPMHPQIDQPDPGKCPICGMPLVKKKRSNGEDTGN